MYVELKHIFKTFNGFHASDDVSFGIEKGKLVALLGPSGSGKTTILRMIAGLDIPDSGDIIIDHEKMNDIPGSKRGVGFVFQNYALFRYMTVFDNIAFGLEVKKMKRKDIKERVEELLSLVGMENLGGRYPNQLSGGQRQRVAFARALAPNPHLLLLDEPFAAIDAKVRKELRTWLREMISRVGVTSIFVTHDQEEAIEVADEIIITNEGKVEQIGTPLAIYHNPESLFVAQFIGQSTVINDFEILKAFQVQERYTNAVLRPGNIKLFKMCEAEKVEGGQHGVVVDTSFRGGYIEVKVKIDDIILIAFRDLEEAELSVGERVKIVIKKLHLFT
ncbi:MAG: ABC transporter ATP-binding protein [Lachnoclostridium sp.]|jgi:sulfate transport system ATP-binding protein|nr:ABC transporter ATP-binding protein [Lachnoclostridium sp.]